MIRNFHLTIVLILSYHVLLFDLVHPFVERLQVLENEKEGEDRKQGDCAAFVKEVLAFLGLRRISPLEFEFEKEDS